MPINIEGQTLKVMRTYDKVALGARKVFEQLSSGKKMELPGDHTVNFHRIQFMGMDRTQNLAKIRGIQTRSTWYEMALGYLDEIRQSLSEMDALAIRASGSDGSPNDYRIWDDRFQSIKRKLSLSLDGSSGQANVGAAFNSQAIFLEFAPDVDMNHNFTASGQENDALNFYTSQDNPGFPSMTLLTQEQIQEKSGYAISSSGLRMTLDKQASDLDDAYMGQTVKIVAGTGSGQSANILSYFGDSHELLLDASFTTPLDSTSEYLIEPMEVPSVSPRLYGTAQTGSGASSLILPDSASEISDIYQGSTLIIRQGTGEGQVATISSYDGIKKQASFETPLSTALDNSSQFVLVSPLKNTYVFSPDPQKDTLRFAEHIWGADNYRLNRLDDNLDTFKSLTETEEAYRQANGIVDTDLNAYTDEEKIERRKLNIFDHEFGSLKNSSYARRMMSQIANALDQVNLSITRFDAKFGNLQRQKEHFEEAMIGNTEAIEKIESTDVARNVIQAENFNLTQQILIPRVMKNILATFRGLNQLIQNQGRQ